MRNRRRHTGEAPERSALLNFTRGLFVLPANNGLSSGEGEREREREKNLFPARANCSDGAMPPGSRPAYHVIIIPLASVFWLERCCRAAAVDAGATA